MPSNLTVDAVLSQDDNAVVWIPHLEVYPNGFRINVAILLNPNKAADIQSKFMADRWARCGLVSDSLTAA